MLKNTKYILILFAILLSSNAFSQYQQSKKMTQKYFSNPDVQFNTPAFDNFYFFTRYKEMIKFLEKQIKGNEALAKIEYIGKSQRGREIPTIYLGYENSENKVRVFMQGGLHGNEPGSTEAMLATIDYLLNTQDGKTLLEQLYVCIIPMANIDGYTRQDRYAANNSDLNRDQVMLKDIESKALKSAFSKFSPHVGIDFHEFNPIRADFRNLTPGGVTHYYDALFLYSGNLNIDKEIRSITEDLFVANAKKEMSENELRTDNYFSTTQKKGDLSINLGGVAARSSATSYGLTNCISILMEIRGSTLGRTSFTRRVNTSFLLAKSYLNTTADNKEKVQQTIANAHKRTLEMSTPIVVDSDKKVYEDTKIFLDVEKLTPVNITMQVNDASQLAPVLTRKRPHAYILKPDCILAIENLITLGATVDTLKSNKELSLETYRLLTAKSDPVPFQGILPFECTTNLKTKKVQIPAGSFVVYLDQKIGNLIATLMEPEHDNGFVRFRVIELDVNGELPYFRYMNKNKL